MKKLLTFITVIITTLPGVAESQDRKGLGGGARHAQDLQGEWQPVDFQRDGKSVQRVVEGLRTNRWIVQGDEATDCSFASGDFGTRDARGDSRVTLMLDSAKLPKEIDNIFTFVDPKHQPEILPGIYSLDGRRLTICVNRMGQRPTEFKTMHGDGNVLTVYERVESDPAVTLEFAKIQSDFSRANWALFEAMQKAKTVVERRKIDAEIAFKPESFADRYLKYAVAHPDGYGALVALCRAAFHAPKSESGAKAITLLQSGRVAQADLSDLNDALQSSRTASTDGQRILAPVVLTSVKKQLDHSGAAQLLTWVCVTQTQPEAIEAAELIVSRFADSPDISNFCGILSGAASTPLADKCEKYLRTILDHNKHRMVRNRALFALASIVQSGGEARQDEAERLYHQFITEFADPPTEYGDSVEQMLLTHVRASIEEIGLRGLGKPAPELVGEDLSGKPMKLSDFRGKVVLISFWATWCGPCMRMVPHEKALVDRLKDKPFVLVGVNGDIEPEELEKGIERHKITWRSFKNKLRDKTEISAEWKIPGWPTFYLIDQKGVIRKRWAEGVAPEVLDREIDSLIEAGASKSAERR